MLIYAGMGEAYEELKSLIEQQGLSEKAKLLGAIPHETMTEYYALSDIVLVPSVHSAGVEEATSISALEAMGSGSPLIASAVGGLKEIVSHRQDGLLVEEKMWMNSLKPSSNYSIIRSLDNNWHKQRDGKSKTNIPTYQQRKSTKTFIEPRWRHNITAVSLSSGTAFFNFE